MAAPQSLVDEIMDWFDFHRVARIMEALDWKWASAEEGIPCEAELRKQARKLINEAWDSSEQRDSEITFGTGGFYATADKAYNYIYLKFVAAEWETTS